MKTKIVVALLASSLWCISAIAQLNPAPSSTGNITTNAANCNTTNACIILHLASSNVGYSVTASGTWTGTLTVEQSGDNQGSWTSATTTTANTLYTSALTPGITDVRVRGSAAMTGTAVVTITASGPATLQQITQAGGSSSSSSPGPVINVANPTYSGCFATVAVGQDWSTCFASVATASNAAAYASVGTPSVRTFAQTPNTASVSSLLVAATVTAGDTVVVFVNGCTHVCTVSDGVNSYPALTANTFLTFGGTNQYSQAFATAPGAALAFSGNITITDTLPDPLGAFFVDLQNVGSFGQLDTPGNPATVTTATGSTAATGTVTTQDANNLILSDIPFFFGGGAVTAAANVGSMIASSGGTASTNGQALVTNTAVAANTAVTTSVTLSQLGAWTVNAIELRSIRPTIPTVCFPAGSYNYVSGLNFLYPVTLQGCGSDSAWLCYQGSAHAVDFGPTTLTGYGLANGYIIDPFTVEGMRFTCGNKMTEGIYMNNYVLTVHIRHNTFMNFGTATAYAVFSNGNTNDLLMEHNYIWDWDNLPHRGVFTTELNTQLRFLGNNASCVNGRFGLGACYNSSPLITVNGWGNNISDNNINYFCPAVLLQSVNTFATRIQNNYLEGLITAGGTCTAGIVQYATQDGLNFTGNSVDLNPLTTFPIVPLSGAAVLTNARISENHFLTIPAATELVSMNNLVGQTGNVAFENFCSTGLGTGLAPCPKTHTAGGNINRWNNDYSPVLTYAAGTTASYTFGGTYFAAPNCVISPVAPGAITFTITTLNTTTLTVTASGAFTGTVNASCYPDAQ